MFLKKIVSWISENPPYENLNENIVEASEKSLNESTETVKTDDNFNSRSIRSKTLERSLVEQNEITDVQPSNKEKGKTVFTEGNKGSVSLTVSDDKDDNYDSKSETENDNPDCNQFTPEGLSLIRKSVANINFIDDLVKKDNTDIDTNLSSVSNCESQLSFLETVSSSEHSTTSDSRTCRNILTQIKDGVDKEHDNIIMKKSNKCSSVDTSSHQEDDVSISSLIHYAEKYNKSRSSESFYGTLFVVGCSKVLPNHLAGKMNTKYILRKKAEANGLVEDYTFVTSDVEASLSATPGKYVVLYSLDNNRCAVVTLKHDSLSDMFQIGRYENDPIDFSVDDISPLDKARHGISRFACRISVRRAENHEARIYAGAFNSSHLIAVDGSNLAHDYCGKMDGFTTNGVLIYKPDQMLSTNWKEVSISGYIYPVRTSEMDAPKRPRIPGESNILIDGTLIDLCGVTLIWRTSEGLKKIPSEYYLKKLQSTLHKHVPKSSLLSQDSNMLVSQVERAVKKAYIYLACGHVTGLAFSKPPDNFSKGWSCPSCRAIGPIKELTVGTEPGFYFEEEAPSYAAFKPCGHVATQNTVHFWSAIKIPNHRSIQRSLCPFCGQNLNFITKNVKLILPII